MFHQAPTYSFNPMFLLCTFSYVCILNYNLKLLEYITSVANAVPVRSPHLITQHCISHTARQLQSLSSPSYRFAISRVSHTFTNYILRGVSQ